MSADVLIVSDRLPSTGGAGAESVLSALCAMLAGQRRSIDFLVNESKLIKVRFESVTGVEASGLRFYRGQRNQIAAGSWHAENLLTRQAQVLEPTAYRKVFVFGDDNIIRFAGFGGDLIAWPDDPPYLVSQFKSGCTLLPLRSRLRSFAQSVAERRQHSRLLSALRRYGRIVHHAHRHAEQFSEALARPVLYAPPLVPSMLAPRADDGRALTAAPKSGVIHVGHLGGAASLAALEVLLAAPVRRHFAESKQALTMVGKADIPESLKQRLILAGYQLTGFVEDLDGAMSQSRAIVVPGQYAIGARTRILHALSLGNAVVAHRSCLAGMPELGECSAVVLCDSDDDFVNRLARIDGLDSAGLESLGRAAVTFMDVFAPAVKRRWQAFFE